MKTHEESPQTEKTPQNSVSSEPNHSRPRPKVFISYSWDDEEHKKWVLNFAKRLLSSGIAVILDVWQTALGDQLPKFMENAISDSDFVLCICTPDYKDRSDNRTGGVGYEGNIITSELITTGNQRKFIPVFRKGEKWLDAAPVWSAGKKFVDLRGNPYSTKNYNELLNTLFRILPNPPRPGPIPQRVLRIKPEWAREPYDRGNINPHKEKNVIEGGEQGQKIIPNHSDGEQPHMLAIAVRIFLAIAVIGGIVWVTSRDKNLPTPTQEFSPVPTETFPPSNNSSTPAKQQTITPLPSSIMVLVPGGNYSIGSNEFRDEQPVHTVLLNDFYIDQYEVTNALYAACVDAGVCSPPQASRSATRSDYYGNEQYADFPVIHITWEMAKVFCENWRGARLPTEAEWEAAARGTNGEKYPWGDNIDCNYSNFNDWGRFCVGDTIHVGSYELGKSTYGVYDLAGNVAEWVSDWYDEDYYWGLPHDFFNPTGPSTGLDRVIRGGSWADSAYAVRSANRNWRDPEEASQEIGFRCAASP